ncbi:MAG: FAD-containing oxidoreductase [Planctomycetota bacterium]|nr:MAG: FAD-containing oxidoreductase [Planctomycetota bacterium]
MSRPELLAGDPHDDALRAAVAPPDWANPRPAGRYDLLVLGGGTAGLVAAAGAAGLGARVALVERKLLGGDCLNHGCVPSKALLRAAKAVGEIRAAGRLGVAAGEPAADFAAVMERMRRRRAGIADHDGAERFRSLGVDVFLGSGRFTGPASAEVATAAGEVLSLRFKRALIATGARPAAPPVPGLAGSGYRTNLTLFTLTELPRRLVVVGGGPIGVEMAQAFARFGSRVTILSLDERLLPREDPEAADLLHRSLERDGVRLELCAALAEVRRGPDGVTAVARRGEEMVEATGDELLLAAGRTPNTEDLGLEAAGVRLGRRGVEVDDRLRTSNRRIFAAGDVAGSWQFTHAADAMARIVLRNAFFFGRGRLSALSMPWCTYTMPEIAHTGLYEHESERAGTELACLRLGFEEIDRALLDEESEGFAKVIYERRSGRLRGATVVAPHAGELIGEMLLPVARRLPVTALSGLIHPYPTQVSVWGRLGDLAMRAKLTPRAARVLRRIIRLRR